jgi:hypothetical protein
MSRRYEDTEKAALGCGGCAPWRHPAQASPAASPAGDLRHLLTMVRAALQADGGLAEDIIALTREPVVRIGGVEVPDWRPPAATVRRSDASTPAQTRTHGARQWADSAAWIHRGRASRTSRLLRRVLADRGLPIRRQHPPARATRRIQAKQRRKQAPRTATIDRG